MPSGPAVLASTLQDSHVGMGLGGTGRERDKGTERKVSNSQRGAIKNTVVSKMTTRLRGQT